MASDRIKYRVVRTIAWGAFTIAACVWAPTVIAGVIGITFGIELADLDFMMMAENRKFKRLLRGTK